YSPGRNGADTPVPGQVRVPDGIRVQCPMRGGLLVQLDACNGCDHYRGLTRARFPGSTKHTFREQHPVILCAFPRAIALLEEAETPRVVAAPAGAIAQLSKSPAGN